MTAFVRRLTWWVRRRQREAELAEELQFHLAEEADERRSDGAPDDEAAWAARRDIGSTAIVAEDARRVWTWTPFEQLVQDLRFAARVLARNRMFASLAAVSLALGIGANTAIYSAMDALLFRPLPVPKPDSLVLLEWRSRPFGVGSSRKGSGSAFVMHSIDGHTYADRSGVIGGIFPYLAFEHLRDASRDTLSSLFAYHPAGNVTILVGRDAQLAAGEYVSGDFFRGLEVSPGFGRLLLPNDDRDGASPVAVVSRRYGDQRFGDAAKAIGASVLINNAAFTIVGVTPAEFTGVNAAIAPDVYVPLHLGDLVDSGILNSASFVDRHYYWLEMMGRLRPGVARAQAQAALATAFAAWVAPTATNAAERANLPALRLAVGAGGFDTLWRRFAQPVYVLLGMVALMLAIACANTANLLLARAAARRREIAVRLGIGAARSRIVRQLLTESLLLGVLAGAVGLLVALGGIRVMTLLFADSVSGTTLPITLNWHVLLATLALSLLCGVVFGLVPAIQATRPEMVSALKESAIIERRHGLRRVNLRQLLVIAQIAMSALLLVGAGLFLRTLANMQSVQLGFSADHLLLFELNAPQSGYSATQAVRFYDDVRQRLAAMSGTRGATLSHASLITAGRQSPLSVGGVEANGTKTLNIGAGFFSTMRIPILQGREIDDGDRRRNAPVAVVSDLFARTYFHDLNPLGHHVRLDFKNRLSLTPVDFEVVGVAANVRYGGLRGPIPPVVYLSYAQVTFPPLRQMAFAVRTSGDPSSFVRSVHDVVRQIDPRIPVTKVRTQTAEIDQAMSQETILAWLSTIFAALALLIACVGLYATMAYGVERRTGEIGIRMALGARQGTVRWMVLREACALAVVGLAIGIPIALGVTRLVTSFLYGVTPNDPYSLSVAIAMLAAATLLAAYGPAHRASRISPMRALRNE